MHFARRAATGALALTMAYALAACSPQDSGNNTLTGSKSPAPATGGPQSTAAAAPGGTVDVDAKDNEFSPKQLSAKAGDITIDFTNTGAAPHTFTAAELHADQNVDAGKETKITLTGVKPGTYKFVCKYHESLGMVGELVVT